MLKTDRRTVVRTHPDQWAGHNPPDVIFSHHLQHDHRCGVGDEQLAQRVERILPALNRQVGDGATDDSCIRMLGDDDLRRLRAGPHPIGGPPGTGLRAQAGTLCGVGEPLDHRQRSADDGPVG